MEKPKTKAGKILNTNQLTKNTRAKQGAMALKKQNKAHLDWVNKSKIDTHIKDMQSWAFEQVEDARQKADKKQPVIVKSIQTWLNERYISRSQLDHWMEDYPELKVAVANTRAILGELREIVVAHGNINTATITASWPAYCPEARDTEIFRAEQKAKTQAAITNQVGGGKIVIEMIDYIGKETQPKIVEIKEDE